MNKDLFGNDAPVAVDPAAEELRDYDIRSFAERLQRLKYINQVYPFGRHEFGSDESHRIFKEATDSFVFGHFVSVIVLAQSFIERRIQEYFHMAGDKRYKLDLFKLLEEFKTSGFIDQSFINRINKIRLKRNPFVHRKDVMHKENLRMRSLKEEMPQELLLEKDAKDAIALIMEISQFRAF